MKYLSTFTGIGGFELGILAADPTAECIGYSEIDKYAIKVYERQFNGHKNYGDITNINAENLPDFDLLVGGFPCQAFSVAGKRRGFEDTRGTLFFDLARILKAKTPRLFVFENVKGLLSHDDGNTFKTIIAAIDELGYDCQWQVINSKNHGVPQNRERIIIVGHLRGTPRPEVFPLTGQSNQNTTLGISTETAVARTLTGGGHSGGNHSGMTIIKQLNNPTHSNDRVYAADGISPTLNTMQGGLRQPFVASYNRNDGVGKELEEAHTLSSSDYRGLNRNQNQNAVIDLPRIRRLTPIECERLQGFPDNWTKYDQDGGLISDTQRYKMCGNAVTTNVIQAVMERLIDLTLNKENQ